MMLKYARLALGVAAFCLAGAIGYGLLTLRPSQATQVVAQVAPRKPVVAPPAPPAPLAAAPVSLSARLGEAGVKTCRARLDHLGAGTMGNVAEFAPASNWNLAAPDQHVASILLGQKYAETSAVPFGFTGLIGAPDGRGTCDGVSVQVLPSPLGCAQMQQNFLQKGKLIGNLAGLPLLQDDNSQVVLLPSAGGGCVLVALRSEYAPN